MSCFLRYLEWIKTNHIAHLLFLLCGKITMECLHFEFGYSHFSPVIIHCLENWRSFLIRGLELLHSLDSISYLWFSFAYICSVRPVQGTDRQPDQELEVIFRQNHSEKDHNIIKRKVHSE